MQPPSPYRARRRTSECAGTSVNTSTSYSVSVVADRVIGVFGHRTVAKLLGVKKDIPLLWAAGKAEPAEEIRVQLADLDSFAGYLLVTFTPKQASLWLEGEDPYLGSRPLDVYQAKGAAPVIQAMKAYQQGSFA